MSNPLTKEITSCLNDTLVKSLNTVIENITKTIDNLQTTLTKSLKDNAVLNEVQPISNPDSPTAVYHLSQ